MNKFGLMESSTNTSALKFDEETLVDSKETLAQEETSNENQGKIVLTKELGAFQHLPMVVCSRELLGSALRKARNIGPTKGICNIAKRERNKGAKQLDTLTKELALPLRVYIEKFPRNQHLHAYEYSLIDLTFGTGKYEEVLENVNTFRKKILDVGKNYASLCAKSTSKRGAEEVLKEGFSKLEEHFRKNGGVVDELVSVAKVLRAMPVFSLKTPTLCLVGAPNVGKSSLVRVLSTGKPEVCNYPFTTRGISMGHIFVQTDVYQVTDTPGLLRRPDDERNNMERLTLAALSYLPTAVLYVHDLTGECGVKVSDQLLLYKEIKEKFHQRPWLDVVSKADLLLQSSCSSTEMHVDSLEFYKVFGPEGALHVSVQTGLGTDELKQRVLSLLSDNFVTRESYVEEAVE
ncbi:hypothetical protein GOP47_0021442 [Adiantum capillus-veneris]|nr:hypothetical protein GOP47_0021442 [Adiantum capillus-veneris]